MNNLIHALSALHEFCSEADVIEQPAIELKFSDKRDMAYFEAHLKNSLDPCYVIANPKEGMTLHGFPLKLSVAV